ncbi:hypothetical protein B0T20DRAFT_364112 [Sordaria brevicollis]|uniref:Uncharacterized protein n=1 Tax=Sordaria brevicollis TaxID=83679 RepID=A0AAE0U3B0_SORBR|nr:hypothetical protein B0T20DRAFT_364112 [Sordaria brevicollis]
MKFTTTAAFLLATGITAVAGMPWSSSSKAKTSSSVFEEDITLRIEVVPKSPNHKGSNQQLFFGSGSTAAKKAQHSFFDGDDDEKPEICWRLCAGEDLRCPEGWHSKNFGGCHTCCKTLDDESVDL